MKSETSSQDGSIGNLAHLLTQSHPNYNKNIEEPSFRTVRNQVEWKSDNHGIKETTARGSGGCWEEGGKGGKIGTTIIE